MQKIFDSLNKTRWAYWILALGTLLLYAPTLFFQFIYYDDNEYVFENARLQAGLSIPFIKWAFTTFHFSNWHPLTWISYGIDWELFGTWAGGYHLTNIIFHTINSLLVFFLFSRMTRSPIKSFLIAALFAWHPVRVESVAWIAERKDVLSTFFILLTTLSYLKFVITEKTKAGWFYFLTLTLFVLSLMSKPMYVTLPIILFLFDFWPLERKIHWSRQVIEKIPFILLSAISCYVTIKAQSTGGAIHHFADYPPPVRFANISQAYWDYILLFLWPAKLSIFYPYIPNAHVLRSFFIGIMLGLVTLLLFLRRKQCPPLWVGWAFFGIMVFPVAGVITIGAHWIACRYLYGPAIGLSIMLIWGGDRILSKIRFPRFLTQILLVSILGGCIATTSLYLAHWQNSYDLFSYAEKTIPHNWVAHINLRAAYGRDGNHEKAAEHYLEAMKIFPAVTQRIIPHWLDFYYMGKVNWRKGQLPQAESFFKESARQIALLPPEKIHPDTKKDREILNNCLLAISTKQPENCIF